MNASCDQTVEVPTILSAPNELTIDAKESMFNHFDMLIFLLLALKG